jgi:phospholipase/carboxylesterase
MTLPSLTGPRLPARSGATRQLVVFLHGYGADGNDLIDLGRQWAQILPDAAFVSPHAPEPCGMSPMGRQWFALTMRDPTERWRGATKARPTLDAFLDEELRKLGLDETALALVGFSQGAMMALHVGLRRPKAPAAIVSYSGALVGPEHLGEATARGPKGEPPRVLMIHGDGDEVIPVDALFDGAEALAKANLPCEFHLSLGLGHGIDGGGLTQGALFTAAGFGIKTKLRRR